MVTQTKKSPKKKTPPYFVGKERALRIIVTPDDSCEQWCKLMELLLRNVGRMCPNFDMSDVRSRRLICTSSDSKYGHTGHWIISVEGTPPRGTILFDNTRYSVVVSPAAVLMCRTATKRLTGKDYKAVEAFARSYLPELESAGD